MQSHMKFDDKNKNFPDFIFILFFEEIYLMKNVKINVYGYSTNGIHVNCS